MDEATRKRLFDLAVNKSDDDEVRAALQQENLEDIEIFTAWFGWKNAADRQMLFYQEVDKHRAQRAQSAEEEARRPTLRKIWWAFLDQVPTQAARGLYIVIGMALMLLAGWLWNLVA